MLIVFRRDRAYPGRLLHVRFKKPRCIAAMIRVLAESLLAGLFDPAVRHFDFEWNIGRDNHDLAEIGTDLGVPD